jgi:uncharacterized protein (DUF433 family)
METALLKRITIIPGLMSGKPTIRGMRFPVGDILEMLANGMSQEEILDQHPILEKEDIQASLTYAAFRTKNTLIINAA